MKFARYGVIAAGALLALFVITSSRALAHKGKHTPEQLKAFETSSWSR